jgi:hypothetical protein
MINRIAALPQQSGKRPHAAAAAAPFHERKRKDDSFRVHPSSFIHSGKQRGGARGRKEEGERVFSAPLFREAEKRYLVRNL